MTKFFILLLISLKTFASGVETAKVYDCKSAQPQSNFQLKMLGESLKLTAPLFGECAGRAVIIGGDARGHLTDAALGGGSCRVGLNLRWYGNGLEPGKKFNLRLTKANSTENYLCTRLIDREQYEL